MEEIESDEEGLPGPPPDPSSIPSVVRAIGELDVEARAEEHGASKETDPDISAIREFLEEVEDLEPCLLYTSDAADE